MADPFGIIGLIGVATQIIQLTVQFGLDWKDAPSETRSFLNELQGLKTVLSETNTNIILNPDFVEAFHGRHSTILAVLASPTQEKSDTQVLLAICRAELDNLIDDLKKRTQGHRAGWERVKGAFLSRKTREAVENLHRQCQTLNSMLAIDTLSLGVEIHKEVTEERKEQKLWRENAAEEHYTIIDGVTQLHMREDKREAAEGKEAILAWLNAVDYASQQNDVFRSRHEGTGQWLLDSTEYRTWLSRDNTTLFSPGIPGAGKTTLTSIIIHDLMARFQHDSSVQVVFLYCDFRRHHEQNAEELLKSLLKQLIQGLSSLPKSLRDLHDMHKSTGTSLFYDELPAALQATAAMYSRLFIVVDALDECQAADGCLSTLLSEIFKLQRNTKANVFATSRYIPQIVDEFVGSLSLEIRAKKSDVLAYLDGRMSHLPGCVLRNPELQMEIKAAISDAADGMFLLARLHLDSLKGKKSVKAIRAALKKLPTGSDAYDSAYDDAMERIGGQLREQEELAKQVLTWVIFSRRPLRTIELEHALAVELGEDELDEDNICPAEDMVSVCAGLVTIDEGRHVIRLVHSTAQEYFDRRGSHWFPNAESELATICAKYLSFSEFERLRCRTFADLTDRLRSYPFYYYAACNWGVHARHSSSSSQVLIDFLQKDHLVERSMGASMAYCPFDPVPDPPRNERRWIGLFMAVWYGLEEAVRILYQKVVVEPRDQYGQTPLSVAVIKGHEAIVESLLSFTNVDVNSRDIYGCTPLIIAVKQGSEILVRLLLGHENIKPDTPDNVGRTALSWAVRSPNVDIVKLLLDSNTVDVDLKDHFGRTPLAWATAKGLKEGMRLLLDKHRADPNSQDYFGRTPLFYAAFGRDPEVLRPLLSSENISVNLKDIYGSTALSVAVSHGRERLVNLFLSRNDVELDVKDKFARTPLQWAIRTGSNRIANLLLEAAARRQISLSLEGLDHIEPSLPYSNWSKHCDVCTLRARSDNFWRQCEVCRHPLFHVCKDCFDHGARCPRGHDQFHIIKYGMSEAKDFLYDKERLKKSYDHYRYPLIQMNDVVVNE